MSWFPFAKSKVDGPNTQAPQVDPLDSDQNSDSAEKSSSTAESSNMPLSNNSPTEEPTAITINVPPEGDESLDTTKKETREIEMGIAPQNHAAPTVAGPAVKYDESAQSGFMANWYYHIL